MQKKLQHLELSNTPPQETFGPQVTCCALFRENFLLQNTILIYKNPAPTSLPPLPISSTDPDTETPSEMAAPTAYQPRSSPVTPPPIHSNTYYRTGIPYEMPLASSPSSVGGTTPGPVA